MEPRVVHHIIGEFPSIRGPPRGILYLMENRRGSKFSGQDDSITFINNYMDYFSGRAPQVGDKNESSVSLTHVVNNVWEAVSSEAHAFEVLTGGVVLAEGNFIVSTFPILSRFPVSHV